MPHEIIRKLKREFEIITDEKLEKDNIITGEGVYKENKIYVTSIHIDRRDLKPFLSAIGLIMFILLMFKELDISREKEDTANRSTSPQAHPNQEGSAHFQELSS